MKLLLSIIAVLIIVISIAADATPSTDLLAPNQVTTAYKTIISRRNLMFSDLNITISDSQCLTDTDALYDDPILDTPYTAWEAELDTFSDLNDDEVCRPIGNTGFDCTVDSSKLESHDDLVAACEQVGGTTHLQTDGLNCKIVESGQSFEFVIRLVDLPFCLASSCNVDEVAEELDIFDDESAEEYELGLSFIFGEGVECVSFDPSSGWKLSSGMMSVVAALSWFLF